jgi:radical SAM protein with 4Fe4S-binding SPASM domain
MSIGFVFEITTECNLKCGFCYNAYTENQKTKKSLNTEKIKELLLKVINIPNVEWITFSGGEPLMYSELEDVIKFLRKQSPNIKIGIASNGTLLNEDKINSLINSGVDFFEIPLLASDDKIYNELTQKPYLSRVKTAMSLIKERNIPLNTSITLNLVNLNEIESIVELAFVFGSDMVSLNRFIPTGLGKENQTYYQLSKEQLSEILEVANKKSFELNIPIYITIPIEDCLIPHSDYPYLKFSKCVCGEEKWAIDPFGNLRTCEQNEEILGNLFEESFDKLSKKEAVKQFRNQNLFSYCNTNECFTNCGGGCRFNKINI